MLWDVMDVDGEKNMAFDFGLRLTELRKKRKLTQEAIAGKLGFNKATISAYERGVTMPSVETLKDLAVIYNSSIDYMLGLSDRTHLFIDDLSLNQQEFMLDILKQVRERFDDKQT